MKEKIYLHPDFSWNPQSLKDVYQVLELENPRFSGFKLLKSIPVYVKSSSPISFKKRLRNAFRSTGPWRNPPRIREFHNLQRLREQGLPAVRPLVAAEKRVFGFVERQLLITERVVGSDSLFDLAVQKKLTQDQLVLINWQLGRLVGNMHNTGFCHGDLFLRNILVSKNGGDPSFHFIDCHQGRWKRLPGRAFGYDLGCYEKWAATLFDVEARAHFFAGYLKSRPDENFSKLFRLTDKARQRLVLRRQKRKRKIHQKRQHLDPTFKTEPLNQELIFSILNSRTK
jgi:tRNA A-37 threonylcarbamoyl transferase component Bud32